MAEKNDVPGWSNVIDWFGYSPNFHDAEVTSIDLRRGLEASTIRIHAWRTNRDTTEEGYFRQDRHALITFAIKGITSLKLEGWNHQNVLSELWLDRTADGFVLHLPEIYGLDGKISAADISVSIEPFIS
jgi:Immunity protein 50